MLRWHIEHRVVVIPRSSAPKRIEENFDLWGWSLTTDEVALLDRLSPDVGLNNPANSPVPRADAFS